MEPHAELLRSWQEGIEHFNERRFWEAHEAWERGWRELPPEPKIHVQALIQAAAVFHLLKLGRAGAARSLARRALEKLAACRSRLSAHSPGLLPRIEVPGIEPALARVAGAGEDEETASLLREFLRLELRAELLLSRPA